MHFNRLLFSTQFLLLLLAIIQLQSSGNGLVNANPVQNMTNAVAQAEAEAGNNTVEEGGDDKERSNKTGIATQLKPTDPMEVLAKVLSVAQEWFWKPTVPSKPRRASMNFNFNVGDLELELECEQEIK